MKIAVWKTGHEIADTVADAFKKHTDTICSLQRSNDGDIASLNDALNKCITSQYDCNIGYGILRGMRDLFYYCDSQNRDWFNVDRGYFNPGHFNGYYRVSYKGTQAKWHDDIPQQDIDFKLEDWSDSPYKYKILIIPPTQHVIDFFGLPKENDWIMEAAYKIYDNGYRGDMSVRRKDDNREIDWLTTKGVITFNSSIGWQALQRGIPVYSDPQHSIVGSYYAAKLKNPIDFLSDEYKQVDREPLFRAMRAHQFTLQEISNGKLWPLINHYLNATKSKA